ncbi:hypothetical protein ACHAWO_010641 [Cyclotella atomus]|jgi:hypothetical protein|uniref:Uncharacterized protein n=1 Tax=Cyclotella atomus TaxID=382360 RepID=A0ABD3QS73_9STRA
MTTRHHADSSKDEMVEFIHLSSQSSDEDTTTIRRHALEQLVESSMGAEITAAANAIFGASGSLDDAVCLLAGSASFRVIKGLVQDCNTSLNEKSDSNGASNKRPNTPDPPKAAPKSFSLFDMLDQQKGGFALPPRITAYKVIESYQRELNNGISDDDNETCLDLLEKADDIEDLSPDPDSWEQIRQLLYEGLTCGDTEKQIRYLKVHTSLMDICQRGNQASNKSQSWDLAHNLAAFVLSQANDFAEETSMSQMNLYWDATQQLLSSLHHLALDYISSCVGDEIQNERMLVTLCMILANAAAACITAVIDPLAGWFEVWARFVSPKRMLTIIRCTGFGGVILRRCHQSGASQSTKKLADAIARNADNSTIALADVERANVVQSLSILRIILNQCKVSVATLSLQFTEASSSLREKSLSTLLTSNGVACSESVQEHLNQAEKDVQLKSEQTVQLSPDSVDLVFKPFRDALASNALSEVPHVKWLCTSSLELYDEFTNTPHLKKI